MTTKASGAPLTRAVLRDGVYDRILAMLLNGTLRADERISIDALARRLAVSPTPVREALAHLEATGLVTREALRGYRVAPPLTPSQLEDLIDVRLLVELGALARAQMYQPEFTEALEQAHAEDVEVVRRLRLLKPGRQPSLEEYQTYFAADWGFHLTILEQSRNPYLVRVGEGLSFQVHRMRQTYNSQHIDAAEALGEHGAILEAVRNRDLAGAQAALVSHLEAVRARSTAGAREFADRG